MTVTEERGDCDSRERLTVLIAWLGALTGNVALQRFLNQKTTQRQHPIHMQIHKLISPLTPSCSTNSVHADQDSPLTSCSSNSNDADLGSPLMSCISSSNAIHADLGSPFNILQF